MAYLAALALLCFSAQTPQQTTAAPSNGFTIFGNSVVPVAPTMGTTDLPDEVKSWPGWGPLSGKPSTPFFVDGDWSAVLKQTPPAASAATPALWRVKVLLLPSVDFLSPDGFGNLVERRSGIYGPTRDRIAQALALAATALQVQTSGRLTVNFDTTEDPALYEETVEAGAGLGPKALEAYVTPRINGGSFEANDKLYHGPYHVCLVIHAGLSKPAQCEASGTPTFGIPAPIDDASVSAYAADILRAFTAAASYQSGRHGHDRVGDPSGPVGEIFGNQPLDQVVSDVDLGPVNGASFADALKAGPYQAGDSPTAPFQARSPMSANARLGVVQDSAKGSVLNLILSGVFPSGGFALPLPKPLSALAAADEHFLVFEARTASPNTLGIGAVADQTLTDGPALGLPQGAGTAVALPTDGAWHKVAIDLRGLPGAASATGLYIGFLPDAMSFPKASVQATEYAFANFSLAVSAPADAIAVSNSQGEPWTAKANAARAAAKTGTTPESIAALTQALADPDESVRLNTLLALSANKVAGLEDKLNASLETVNPRICEAAVAALAFQDTPAGWADLQQALRVGHTHTKAVAAAFIAQRKDPASAGQIAALQTAARDWHDRIATVNALAASGTPQALVFLRSSLDDPDPTVRTTTAILIPSSDDEGLDRLKFVGVNDASDAARAAACIKLLQSSSPDTKREGYRGANDDSWWVRVQVLNWIAGHPSADDRQALRQAVTSPFGAVRAASLRAFATSAEPVTLDEISNVLKDQDPAVQRELIALAIAKKLVLPADSVAALKASVAPTVADAAKSLPGS